MGRAIEIIRKFPKFVLSVGLGTVVDTAVLWLLSHCILLLERLFGWDVVIFNLAALCMSGLINASMFDMV
jgi:putative flippase GtrA